MRHGASIGKRPSAARVSNSRRHRPIASAEPAEGFAPLSEVLREIGTTLTMLFGVAAAGYVLLLACGIF